MYGIDYLKQKKRTLFHNEVAVDVPSRRASNETSIFATNGDLIYFCCSYCRFIRYFTFLYFTVETGFLGVSLLIGWRRFNLLLTTFGN